MQIYLLFVCLLLHSISPEKIWDSYRSDEEFHSREETVLNNITVDTNFQLNFTKIQRWKSVCDENCFLAGLQEENVVILSFGRDFLQNSYLIEIGGKINDFHIFTNWNESTSKNEIIAAIALENSIFWYKIGENSSRKFWEINLEKNISHVNIFPIDFHLHFIVVSELAEKFTLDLYKLELSAKENFWLVQTIPLEIGANSTDFVRFGPDYFLAIPQEHKVVIYKLGTKISTWHTINSHGMDQLKFFTIGSGIFLAINGLEASIYRFTRNGLISVLHDSNLHGVNFWLPIDTPDDVLLLAQRCLHHEPHQSVTIDVFTFDGRSLREHEDIHCSYFGETSLGTHCLPGENNPEGIKGSVGFLVGNEPFIMVPREVHSELFVLNVTKKKIGNPMELEMEKLEKLRQYLSDLLDDQEKKMADIQNQLFSARLSDSRAAETLDFQEIAENLDAMTSEMKTLNEKLSQKQLNFTTVIFNGVAEIPEVENLQEIQAENINGAPAHVYLDTLKSDFSVENVEVEDLFVENLNGVSKLFFQGDQIDIQGDLLITQPMAIFQNATASKVNSRHFDLVDLNAICDEKLIFEHVKVPNDVTVENLNNFTMVRKSPVDFVLDSLKVDTLYIPHSVVAANVNGDSFDQFLTEICMTNIENYILEHFSVKGDVSVKEDAEITILNGLEFPKDYVFTQETYPNITGAKFFDFLQVKQVNCEVVNGIDPSTMVTLKTDQVLAGDIKFAQLEVAESFKVDGRVVGIHASKFLPNPTLIETDTIEANANFKELQVEGTIFVSGDFLGANFSEVLDDLVYQDQGQVEITAAKEFPQGFSVKTLEVQSDAVNNISFKSVLNKNFDQDLGIDSIVGAVDLHNVVLNGTIGGVDVSKLDEESVKITGEQFISSTLVFSEGIQCPQLEILETVNDLKKEDFLNVDLDVRSLNPENFDSVEVDGSFVGSIDDFDLDEFDARRLSYAKEQTLQGGYQVDELFVENFEAVNVNDIPTHQLNEDSLIEDIERKLIGGQIKVTDIHIEGSLEIDEINNRSAVNIGGAMRANPLLNVTIHGNAHFDQVQTVNLSRVNFERFLQNLLFKNDSSMQIIGNKTFSKALTVHNLIETVKINSVNVRNVLTNYANGVITAPLLVHGNVTFMTDVNVTGKLNGVALDDNYEMLDSDHCKIKNDVVFSRLAHIDHMEIDGFVNGKLPLLDGLIFKNVTGTVAPQMVFKNRVSARQIQTDGSVTSKILLTSQPAHVQSVVYFNQTVHVNDRISIHGDLEAGLINGIRLEEWMERGIFIDRGLLKGNLSFVSAKVINNLEVKSVNGADYERLVALRSDQELPEMTFEQVGCYGDISVGGTTNGVDLGEEYENTLLLNTSQTIRSNIKFQNITYIEGDVHLSNTINAIKVDQIVTCNTDQNLSAIYNFQSKSILNDVTTTGLVNGIDVAKWLEKSVQTNAHQEQIVTQDWSIENDLIFDNNIQGDALINGLDIGKVLVEVEEKRNSKYNMEKNLIDNYVNICKDLTFMYGELATQHYKFHHFENLQLLEFPQKIHQIHHFTLSNQYYLLINVENNCQSHLYNLSNGQFTHLYDIPTGTLAQIITAKGKDCVYLVVRNENTACNSRGTNVWALRDDVASHVTAMEPIDMLQESLVDNTFYGLADGRVNEYRIGEDGVRTHQTWRIDEENAWFVPRGLSTGLAVSTGTKLLKLHRDDVIVDDFGQDFEVIIPGNVTIESRTIPDNLIVFKVGTRSTKRTLSAVLNTVPASIEGSLDFIKIYEDVLDGRVFQKVPAHNPRYLLSMDFDNGETLLFFIEDGVQVYQYKGILGFEHRLEMKVEAEMIFKMALPGSHVLGVVNSNELLLMEAVMLGNKMEDGLHCEL